MSAPAFQRAVTIAFISIAVTVILTQRRWMAFYRRRLRIAGHDPDSVDNIDLSTFLSKLRKVASIAVPKWNCKEVWATIAFITMFGLKAWVEMVRVDSDAVVVAAIAGTSKVTKGQALTWFVASSLGLATVSGAIEQLRFWLIARYRTILTDYFHDRLFRGLTFYRAGLLQQHDDAAAGTTIASYCHEFAEHFAELPYYFVLPLAEAGASLYFLSKDAGVASTAVVFASTIASLVFLRTTSPEFGRMHAVTLEAEERFRLAHADVRTHSEQLALHRGGDFVRRKLYASYRAVSDSLNQVAVAKGYFGVVQNSVSLGMWDAMPLFLALQRVNSGASTREAMLQALLVQRPLVRKFHESIEALIENIKEASHLFEFTDRLAEFDELLDTAQAHQNATPPPPAETEPAHRRVLSAELDYTARADSSFHLDVAEVSDDGVEAIATETNDRRSIVFTDVSIKTPGEDALINKLSLRFAEGQHWVILGPNGSGKTSIFRTMAGLWQPTQGSVAVGDDVALTFLPQQAFILPSATLFEQLTFPDSLDGPCGQRGIATPQDLDFAKVAMEAAFAEMIVQLVGGWESPAAGFTAGTEDFSFTWESLSGGQQQKLAIARLMFHAQQLRRQGKACFALMDESTSQIDTESEDIIFRKLKHLGVTIISITHRERVISHHGEALVLVPQRKSYKLRHVHEGMPGRSASGTDLVDW